jgi:glyoxylase-like metal-dependent hydrolase (beta-lactamase superfamily II)
VIVSHCHSDHIGSLSLFPDAMLSVQQLEIDFWNGPIATRQQFATTVKVEQIDYLGTARARGKLTQLDGDAQIADGFRVELVGGHCPGQQIAIVQSEGGDVVIASDAMHFYEELEHERPFSVLWNLGDVYRTYDRLNVLQDGGATLVPGHDPEVMRRFPAVGPQSPLIARIA